ncbi:MULTISPECIES: PAS domain S-box protein [unclassified Pseudodesulfovibrio]|uniref:PAS domain-containing hybrid sensor histidine kinase/response regulator n=1 Tax=unclassified Pseudodesulfovibrio TaxID=2661612 RepID=UPI0013E2F0F4|nr:MULTISPECIES: PAS domain S-box protein [unclassified Pseudodesulfovibrio]MCJ2166279.1 PAS domain S-box protein [Pseudodesulfovibrio sp. S3-i]
MTSDQAEGRANSRGQDDSRSNREELSIDAGCFQGLCNVLGDGIVHADRNGKIIQVNPAFCSMLGYDWDELVGSSIFDFTPEETRESQALRVGAFMESGENSIEFEQILIHNGGQSLYVRVNCWLQRGDQGDIQGVWCVFRDMTDQRSAEDRADRNLEKYRFLAENSEDIIWTLDRFQRYTYVSPSVERVRGFKPEELLGTSLEQSVTPESYQRVCESLKTIDERFLHGERNLFCRLELQFLCKDGSLVWGESLAKALNEEDGMSGGVVGSTRDITERKKFEERLRSSEQSLLALLNATEDSVGLFTLDGTVLAMNQNMANFLGQPREATMGRSVYDFIPENLQSMVKAIFTRVAASRQAMTEQVVWSGRILNGIVYPVCDQSEVSTIAVYGRDVTEARFAEEARKKTQEQYRLIVETANEGILGLDADQRITYANKIVAKFLGCEIEEIIGQSFLDYIEPSELEDNRERMVRRIGGMGERYERRFVRKDGILVWGLVSATPLMAEDGRGLGAFAMIADITEVKQAHERLETILDGISADIYVADIETNEILFMNAHMREQFGDIKEGEICHHVIRGQDEPCDFCIKPSLVDAAGNPVGTLVSERYSEKRKRWNLNHDRAIEWLQGKLVHMHMAADITELKNMAAELERSRTKAEAASLAKNEFLANMSHEIRTPLNGLLGMLQLLQLSALEPTQAEYLETALNSGRSLLQVLNDILDLSKVESGKLELEETVFGLAEVLDSVVSTFRYAVEERGLEMSWEVDESLPIFIQGDKGRLRQILFNLVGNAVKFTEKGAIRVKVFPLRQEMAGGQIRILFEVADTGIGIADDKVDSIFDPFSQVDGSLTRKYQGTGLGLGIVHRLVQLMSGSITVDAMEGEGTSIYFTIVAKKVDAPAKAEVKPQRRFQKGLSILIAEDERVNRMVVQRILEKLGHVPVCVESGEAAIEIMKVTSFDLFFTDIHMPGLDGVETGRYIREDLGLDIPIIALTAHAMKDDRDRFIKAGMNGYIAKPFEIDQLQQEIDRVMKEYALRKGAES